MKKIISVLLSVSLTMVCMSCAVFCTAIFDTAVSAEEVSVTGLESGSHTMTLYSSETFEAVVLPENAFNKSVTWSSSDNSVVTVDDEGFAYAAQIGTAVITVKTNDGGWKRSYTITVM